MKNHSVAAFDANADDAFDELCAIVLKVQYLFNRYGIHDPIVPGRTYNGCSYPAKIDSPIARKVI